MGELPASGRLRGAGGGVPARVTRLEKDWLGPRLKLPLSCLRLFLLFTSTNENKRPFKGRGRGLCGRMWWKELGLQTETSQFLTP